MTLTDSGLDHGIWRDGWYPPATAAASSQQYYIAESNGLWTGDEGYTTYTLDDGTVFTISFDNPWSGSNSYSCDVEGDNASDYSCTRTQGGDGDNPGVNFSISLANISRPTSSTIYVSNPNGDWSLSVSDSDMDAGSFVTRPGGVTFGAGSNTFQVQSNDSDNGDSGYVTYQLNRNSYYGNNKYTTVTINFSTDAWGNTNWNCGGSDGVYCDVYVGDTVTTNDLITTTISFGIYY